MEDTRLCPLMRSLRCWQTNIAFSRQQLSFDGFWNWPIELSQSRFLLTKSGLDVRGCRFPAQVRDRGPCPHARSSHHLLVSKHPNWPMLADGFRAGTATYFSCSSHFTVATNRNPRVFRVFSMLVIWHSMSPEKAPSGALSSRYAHCGPGLCCDQVSNKDSDG